MDIPYPTTSIASKRYDNTKMANLSHNQLSSCLFQPDREPEPSYLPPSWSAFTHPEGQVYFFHDTSLRVVTEAYLYRSGTADKVSRWIKWFEDEIRQRAMIVAETVELFLQVEEETDRCEYYFIDHATRTEFWLTQLPTELLGLPATVSTSHTRLVLEEHYWNHVQYFPMHFGGLSLKSFDELIGIFVHGQADQLTSDVSTFPYNAEKSSQFLTLLRGSRGDNSNGYITCVAARLWGFITASRFTSLYGQETARLSRDQAVFQVPISEHHRTSVVASRLLLGAPAAFSSRLKDLYVDKLVYIDQWQKFTMQCTENWRFYMTLALPILISSILISLAPSASPAVALASFIACCSCILSAVALTMRHSSLANVDASDAATYLSSLYSEKFGFQLAAIVFSFPQAFASWSIALLVVQGLIVACGTIGVLVTALASAFMLCLFVTIRLVVSPTNSGFLPSICFWPRSLSSGKLAADEKV